MSNILIVHSCWYEEHISKMLKISSEILNNDFECCIAKAPGAIELAALAKNRLNKSNYVGIIFLGAIIQGETNHYDLITQETFRSIGSLAENYCDIAIINNVICVDNEKQLIERLEKNTKNNTNALVQLINEKSV